MKTVIRCFFCLLGLALLAAAAGACSKPSRLEIAEEQIVLEGVGAKKQIALRVLDQNGRALSDPPSLVFFSNDNQIIRYDQTGLVEGLASGEAEVEVEVVGTDLKAQVQIRVKNPASIKVSHEKLRLWTGQVKEIWAEVHSEKDAFIEGYLPQWTSDDPSVVALEPLARPERRQSWVRLTALKSGATHVNAVFRNLTTAIRVSVFDEDEEVDMDGTRIPKTDKK